jgi:flagellar FliJ protein
MRDPRQLSVLANLAEERRDAAGRRLGRSLALLEESRRRQALLAKYREDYRARLARAAAEGVSGDELRNYSGFLERLEQAIAQQRAEVEALERGVAEQRARWLDERRKERSIDVLAERAEDAARAAEARRLQKLLDEFSARIAATRAAP